MLTKSQNLKKENFGKKSFFIRTFGCQMNEYDSQCIAGQLIARGFKQVDEPGRADIILFNTCSVRDRAEQKFYTHLGATRKIKENRPGTIIGVCGCLAEQEKQKLLGRFPFVQIIAGPGNISKIGELIEKISKDASRIIATGNFDAVDCSSPSRNGSTTAYIPVMRGCNKFCAYCVVPYLRGREKSRPAKEVIEEARQAVKDGYSEIVLLGQNVCAYTGGNGSGENNFAGLLKALAKIDGVSGIGFITSHPGDVSDEMLEAVAGSDRIRKELHLPFQAGSNKVLKAMKRGYTREYYLDLVRKIKKGIPGVKLSTDIIVGFPGETEEDFRETLDVVRDVEFENSFMFKYSDRPNTKAKDMPGKVDEKEKKSRLKRLIELNSEIIKKNRGCTV